jgi:hypothetical protein
VFPDGRQMSDALPLAILLSKAGQDIGPKGFPGTDANGGFYRL